MALTTGQAVHPAGFPPCPGTCFRIRLNLRQALRVAEPGQRPRRELGLLVSLRGL